MQFVILAIDRSLSVDDDAQQVVSGKIEEFRQVIGRHKLALMPFAAQPRQMVLAADMESALPTPMPSQARLF